MAKNRIRYASFILSSFFFYVFYTHHLSFFIFIFFCSLPLLTLLLEGLSFLGLKVGITMDRTSAPRGEPLVVEIEARRKWVLFPLLLRLKLTVINELTGEKKKQVMAIPLGFRKQSAQVAIQGSHCGGLTISFKQVAALDALGLFAFPVKFSGKKQENLWIVPKLIPLEEIEEKPTVITGENDLAALRPGHEVPEIYDFRAYQPGDKPSRIHWKLSSRTDDQVWVKRYSAASPHTMIILDLSADDTQDTLLDVATSLAFSFLEMDSACTFLWPSPEGGQSARIEDEESFHVALHELLSVAFPTHRGALPEMQQEGVVGSIICVTDRATPKMFQELASLYQGAGIVVMKIIHGDDYAKELPEQAASLDIGLQIIQCEESLVTRKGSFIEKESQ